MRFVTQAHHFSHLQSSPVMQSYPTGAGQEVLDHPQTHFPDHKGPEKQFGRGQQIGVSKMSVPFSLLPSGKQSWWFPKEEAQPGSFLTQFTLLPLQRGANCNSQSCLSRRVYPNRGQALLLSHPLSKSSPGRQLSSRDTPQPQPHSREPWTLGSEGIATAPAFAVTGTSQACSGCTRRDHSLSHLGNRLGRRGAECLEEAGII